MQNLSTAIINHLLGEPGFRRLPADVYNELVIAEDGTVQNFDGGDGIDTLLATPFGSAAFAVNFDAGFWGGYGTGTVTGFENVLVTLQTGSHFFHLTGDDEANFIGLRGGAEIANGSNTIRLIGGGGDDFIYLDAPFQANSTIDPGSGNDTVMASTLTGVHIEDYAIYEPSGGDRYILDTEDEGYTVLNYNGLNVGHDSVTGFEVGEDFIYFGSLEGGWVEAHERGGSTVIEVYDQAGAMTGSVTVDAVGLQSSMEAGVMTFG